MMTTSLTPEASTGRVELYKLFDLLRAAELKVQVLRDAGEPFSPEQAQEWQAAYRLFIEAYDVWHRLLPDRPDYHAPQVNNPAQAGVIPIP
jgi:hypothetical protein